MVFESPGPRWSFVRMQLGGSEMQTDVAGNVRWRF